MSTKNALITKIWNKLKNLSQIDVLPSPKYSPIYYAFHLKAVLILSKIKSFACESGVKKKFVVRWQLCWKKNAPWGSWENKEEYGFTQLFCLLSFIHNHFQTNSQCQLNYMNFFSRNIWLMRSYRTLFLRTTLLRTGLKWVFLTLMKYPDVGKTKKTKTTSI